MANFKINDFEIENSILKKYIGKEKDVVIPEGITAIGNGAFRKNNELNSVTIPDSVTSIGSQAFEECSSLRSMTIPEGVTQIGFNCFLLCTALEKVTLPDSLTTVMGDLFFGCSKLQDVNIPGTLKEIGEGMFSNCTSLKEIIIPEGVKTIGRYAFLVCTSLEKVVLPSSLKTIEEYAFAKCTNIKDINIADNIQIRKGAFEECRSLYNKTEYVIIGNELYEFNGTGTEVAIPNKVAIIGSKVFAKNKMIKKVVIPDTVEEIGSEGFKGCSALQMVKLSSRLSVIEAEMFWDCKALEKVEIPEGISIIGESAFRHCYSLKEIKLPYSIKKIQKMAFGGVLGSDLTDIHIIIVAPGTTLDEIYSQEDKFAAAIGYLKYPELYKDEITLKSYRSYLSRRKASLLPRIWKDDMVSGLKAFADCGILTNKTYETLLSEAQDNKAIGCVAFLLEWKNNVRTGVLTVKEKTKKTRDPYSVTAMKRKWKFYDIDAETRGIFRYVGKDVIVDVPARIGNSRVTLICAQAFESGRYNKTDIQEVRVPEGIRKIEAWAFRGCSSLKKVSLPHTLEEIEGGAFCDCTSLTEIELPEGLKIIGNIMFEGCKALASVKMPSTVEKIGEGIFNYYSYNDPLVDSGEVDKDTIIPDLTIIAAEGSVAAIYAKENGIKLVTI